MLYALLVNETNGLVNKSEVREALDAVLRPSAAVGLDPASTLHAWGMTPDAQQGQDAMMRLLGG